MKVLSILSHWILNIDRESKVFGNNVNINDLNSFQNIYIISTLILFGYLVIKAFYYIKISLKDLSVGDYFSPIVISSFKKGGILFLACGFFKIIIKIIIPFILKEEFSFKFDTSIFLFLIIGLLLLFLSEVFNNASQLKQENGLTI